MTIQILADDVAAKIAAGEVVERPANVAKELVENSLDANATEIRVEIREGGQRLLRVIDNGDGIASPELALAFERHATSKLRRADDLNHIATFGFRGEALYSIAAVSHLTITTRARSSAQANAEPFGAQARLEGGHLVHQGKAGAPVGTVINVENLFYNMPARKKFLRTPATESGRIAAVIQRYALAYPERRFSFVNDGRLVFQSNGSGDLFDVLVKLYGLENAKQMAPVGRLAVAQAAGAAVVGEAELDDEVDFMSPDALAPTRLVARDSDHFSESIAASPVLVSGFASLPSLTRANRSNIDLFVNRRYVEDRSLTYAVIQAYHTLLPVGRFPLAAIFVEMDPELVDVNVHPQKTQVRFHEERRIFSAVQKEVRRVIISSAPIPDMALPPSAPTESHAGERPGNWALGGWSARRDAILNAGQQRAFDFRSPPAAVPPTEYAPEYVPEMPPREQQAIAPAAAEAETYSETASTTAEESTRQVVEEKPSKLPPLRVVGQVGAMYIITEGPEGLFLIDQHAAHERILYEQFMARRAADSSASQIGRQHLLEPLTLHTGSEIAGMVAQHLGELNQVGFEIEPFGGDTFLVRAIPAVLSGQDPQQALQDIVTALGQRRNLVGETLEARLVKMVCKRAAIKAGQLLSDIEMQELVRQLEECHSPRTCPHGRPTMIQLSANELEKAFGRV
ncbi:MAG: DNA mismatch repair endonuclease MutL [Caldilineaceae bacterium]|nr:DNA mismatch repair endonuclease MutL [Caldilineaceae bacterium]